MAYSMLSEPEVPPAIEADGARKAPQTFRASSVGVACDFPPFTGMVIPISDEGLRYKT
jgi:hypothetical protein